VIDRIVPEPLGGAHRDAETTIAAVGTAIREMLAELDGQDRDRLRADRRRKFLDMGSKGLAA
jgi:acetyl-CoA carboxylase carboxyl transferase subunit alpha